jgi:hypothetical protein
MNIDFDIKKINEFVQNRPFLFNSAEYISSNRLLSYCTFMIKDIYEYLSSKLNDGSLAIFVRKAPIQIKKYEEQLII